MFAVHLLVALRIDDSSSGCRLYRFWEAVLHVRSFWVPASRGVSVDMSTHDDVPQDTVVTNCE